MWGLSYYNVDPLKDGGDLFTVGVGLVAAVFFRAI